MGLWTNELDLYGRDRRDRGEMPPREPPPHTIRVAHGVVPLSGMNLAFKRELAPAFLFTPYFESGGKNFRRHDDIWGGYILQKIMQKLRRKLSYGRPFVFHDTAIDAHRDAAEEHHSIEHEVEFYDLVDTCMSQIEGDSYASFFSQFAQKFSQKTEDAGSILASLGGDFTFWAELFR